MSLFRINFPNFWPGRRRPRPVAEDHFRRRLDNSQALQHMCGFDTELYAAINGLNG